MLDAIRSRRSIRDGFTDQPVSERLIEEIISCALSAPSSKNAQPWKIHVVTSRPTLVELADAVERAKDIESYVPIDPATGRERITWSSTVVESAEILRSAILGLFVENRGCFSAGRRTVAYADEGHRENALVGYGFEMVGIGAAIENMWLAAHVHGLGGVFMGDVLIAEEIIRQRLGMAGDLVGVLALGYTNGEPAPKQLHEGCVTWHW